MGWNNTTKPTERSTNGQRKPRYPMNQDLVMAIVPAIVADLAAMLDHPDAREGDRWSERALAVLHDAQTALQCIVSNRRLGGITKSQGRLLTEGNHVRGALCGSFGLDPQGRPVTATAAPRKAPRKTSKPAPAPVVEKKAETMSVRNGPGLIKLHSSGAVDIVSACTADGKHLVEPPTGKGGRWHVNGIARSAAHVRKLGALVVSYMPEGS
jgi:hypothetical protein